MRFILKLRTCTIWCATYGTTINNFSSFGECHFTCPPNFFPKWTTRSWNTLPSRDKDHFEAWKKKIKSLIEVPYLAHLKVHVLSFNMNVFPSPQRVPRPSYPFWENFGRSGKGLFAEKLKSLIEVPYVAHLKVQVLSFNMNLIFSLQRVPRPGYPFRYKFGRSGKGPFTEKDKIGDRGSTCSAPDNTGFKPQYELILFSVACSQTELPISG